MNKSIVDKKYRLMKYFGIQNPSLLVRDLIRAHKAKNEQLVNNINSGLIDLRNAINRKKIPENENPNQILNIAKKICDFNKGKKKERN